MKVTLLILVSIAGVVLGFSPALLRSIIQGGKKFAAPRAARRSSGFSQSSGATYPRYRGRKVPAVQSRLVTEAPRLIDEVVVESSNNPIDQSVVPSKFRKIIDEEPDLAKSIDIVQSIDEELATKFTIEACKYFETFDCDETCNLCKLCDTSSGSQRPECSKQCARGAFNCKTTCKAGQDQCSSLAARYSNGVTNRFSRISTEIVPQNTEVSQFAGLADFTAESCQYFEVFNCKETCGLCTLCDNTQKSKDRAECKTLCTLGVNDCTKACEAGQERCSGFVTTPSPAPRSKTIPQEIDNEVATQFTIDACQYFANFNCEETCGICNLCDQPGFDSNRPECSTQCAGGEVKCTKSCKAGQEQCLLLASRFSDAATGIIPMGTDFDDFSKMAEFTVESCDYFSSFNCKDTCGLCNLCNVIPGGSKRPECNTLCNSGVNTCTAVCEAGQARCAKSAKLVGTPAPEPVVVSKAVETQFTIDSCKYFTSFDCDESCGLCSLCGSTGYDAPECSAQCAGGIEKCKKSCNAGQEQCVSLASRFAEAATSVIPMNSDFADFSALSELTVDQCDYFMSFNCKESCGLCNLCNLVPGGSKRTECTTLCASGINTCTSVCEAGQARCAKAPQLATTPAPKEVAVTHEDVAEFTVQSCKYFSKFNCQKSCGLCKFCSIPGIDKTRPECKKHCGNGIEACTFSCIAGQAKCFEFISPISDLSVAIDAGALTAAITVDSCELFGQYTCKDTCGLCNLCNLAPGGSDRPECTTLCNLGINKCYSVCEAGKAKCSEFSPSTTTSLQTKAIIPRTSNNQNSETEISMDACKFDCEKTCDLCDVCTPDSTQAQCSTLCKLGKDKCSEYCTNGQEKCLKYFADFYRQKSNFFAEDS